MDAADLLNPDHRNAAVKILFGSIGRFSLAAWLLGRSNPVFRLSDYARETGNWALASGHMTRFLQMGMVGRVALPPLPPATVGPVLYQRLPSPLWRVYATALEVLGDPVAAENEQMRADLLKLVARHTHSPDPSCPDPY